MKRRHTYQGRVLNDADLEQIRAAIASFDTIDVIDGEMRAIAEIEWPELLAAKLKPSPHDRGDV